MIWAEKASKERGQPSEGVLFDVHKRYCKRKQGAGQCQSYPGR